MQSHDAVRSPPQTCELRCLQGLRASGWENCPLILLRNFPSPSRLLWNHSRWKGHDLFLKYLSVKIYLTSSGKLRTRLGSSSFIASGPLRSSRHSGDVKGIWSLRFMYSIFTVSKGFVKSLAIFFFQVKKKKTWVNVNFSLTCYRQFFGVGRGDLLQARGLFSEDPCYGEEE